MISKYEKLPARMEDSYNVPNLVKGIAVLELLASSPQGLPIMDIRKTLDISQTTFYRILNTLVKSGYIHYNDRLKTYGLTRKMLSVGFSAFEEHSLLELTLPKLREIRDAVGETVCFGIMGSDKGLFIEQALGTRPFCFILTRGKQLDLHCSAPGKAMMAFMPEPVRRKYLDKIEYTVYNANTIMDEAAYLKELEKVRECGYAVDMEEELRGVVCVGAPVFNYYDAPCGSVWISGPRDRISDETIEEYAGVVMDATRSISRELGAVSCREPAIGIDKNGL